MQMRSSERGEATIIYRLRLTLKEFLNRVKTEFSSGSMVASIDVRDMMAFGHSGPQTGHKLATNRPQHRSSMYALGGQWLTTHTMSIQGSRAPRQSNLRWSEIRTPKTAKCPHKNVEVQSKHYMNSNKCSNDFTLQIEFEHDY